MYVPITALAKRLGVERTNARKIAIQLGYQPTRRQFPDLGHRQRVLCWTEEEVQAMINERKRQGFEVRT